MLIAAELSYKNGAEIRLTFFNPENVLYMDEEGVLFAPGVHRPWAEGEWLRLQPILAGLCAEDEEYT